MKLTPRNVLGIDMLHELLPVPCTHGWVAQVRDERHSLLEGVNGVFEPAPNWPSLDVAAKLGHLLVEACSSLLHLINLQA